ncbi:uncharacterized protein BO96DRAFT_409811 [Aspergillus niger CBS 101883]|uniref:uncharacterized protein n=1 Tax=Aspergillus lacticoffeatus (strain CBS 101883) TaxID=1450533 RepID=UPI000D7FFE34|nr:uncharacterized protein BO96DRAFT_409811 [Aspergillus niger CBS 101883]PYH59518.1 hypothetical protein BO96DRAFT_409811 [Aspergillus niger CBS 101883]
MTKSPVFFGRVSPSILPYHDLKLILVKVLALRNSSPRISLASPHLNTDRLQMSLAAPSSLNYIMLAKLDDHRLRDSLLHE